MANTIEINGVSHEINTDEQMPLLWYLRDVLAYTGTKFGCGKGLCGACTVHLDGQATRSCVLPLSAAIGRKVTTIEGLSEDGSHPLQIAWVEQRVPQRSSAPFVHHSFGQVPGGWHPDRTSCPVISLTHYQRRKAEKHIIDLARALNPWRRTL